jgi:glycogen debranching enzyme
VDADVDALEYRSSPGVSLPLLLAVFHGLALLVSIQSARVFVVTGQAFEPGARGVWDFAYRHLRELQTPYGFAASDAATGHYAALFGRDSLWILMFLLEAASRRSSPAFNEWVEAKATAIFRELCDSQGTRVYDLTEEQPGKIIHESREQLDQRLRESGLPFEKGRSYSGFDQTFLFIVAYKRFRELFPVSLVVEATWPHVIRALDWIEQYADADGDGLFKYRRRHPSNLLNQVWKDSYDSVVRTGFDVPRHPLAWIEIQAYAFRAFHDAADVYEEKGDVGKAEHLRSRAAALRDQVNDRFWLREEDCFAVALDARKSPITMVTSNPGHALWAGMVDPPRLEQMVNRLLQNDLMTRYGLRTLSSKSPFYAPFAYHRGNIWPFDNAVFVSGLLKYQYRDQARLVIESVCRAIAKIQCPIELYIVLEQEIFVEPPRPKTDVLVLPRPIPKNQNQGWTAAALLYFAAALTSMTGTELEVD